VFFITVLATSVTHCPGFSLIFFAIAWNKVDFPVDDGPIKYSVLMVELVCIVSSRSGNLPAIVLVVYSMGRRSGMYEPMISGLILPSQPHFLITR
jgi:hypothetical protein